jgi:hypothetical protein
MEKIILRGVPVYTSDKLRDELKTMIDKEGNNLSKELLIQLVDNQVIIPVINEPNVLKQFIMKIRKQDPYLQYGFALNGKAYVILNKGISPKDIIDTALHEVLHIAHRQETNKFTVINKNIYHEFYYYFYKKLFNAKEYDSNLFDKFLNDLYGGMFNSQSLYDAFKDHSKLSKNKIEEIMNLIFKIWDASDNGTYDKLPANIVFWTLRKTYRSLFKTIDYQTGVGQELWNPAEIICVLSTINPEHVNVIKSLKLITPGKKAILKKIISNKHFN